MTKAASTPQTHPASARNHPPPQVDAATKAMSARSRRVYRSKASPPISPAAACCKATQAPRGAGQGEIYLPIPRFSAADFPMASPAVAADENSKPQLR